MIKQLVQSRPMSILTRVSALLTLLLTALPGFAEIVENLYRVTVPVDSYATEERSRATRTALAQLLVRLTGDSRASRNPELAGVLDNAQSYVLQFGYASLPAGAEGEAESAVTINFSEEAVNSLLRRSQVPVWPANRPLVLVWLVTDSPDQGRHFIASETHNEVYEALIQAFQRRAVPLQLPLLDLRDQMLLSPQAAWNFDSSSIRAAAERYEADLSIVLRFYHSSAGSWRGAWLLEGEDNSVLESIRADSLEELVVATTDMVIDRFAPRYSYIPTSTAEGVNLVIRGVHSYYDFSQVMALFSGLEIVKDVQVQRASGDRIFLELEIEGDAAVLQQAIDQDSRLVVDQSSPLDATSQPLIWLGSAD